MFFHYYQLKQANFGLAIRPENLDAQVDKVLVRILCHTIGVLV